jgi:methylmalonyl-CoA mutase N-terminal domain/subunit
VGVNDFVEEGEEVTIPILLISPEAERRQRKRMAEVRASRNQEEVERVLGELKQAAADNRNIVPPLIECTRAYVTLGEMCGSLTEVFGVHDEVAVF